MTDADYNRLIHSLEQDEAAAVRWWGSHSAEEKELVWKCIQRNYADPVVDTMSRLAQIAFKHVAIMAERQARETA
jgi:hypothetical protein